MNEHEAYIALNMMEKVGPVTVRSLVGLLGSARAIFEAGRDALVQAEGVGRETAAAILAQRDGLGWEAEIERAASQGVDIVAQIDPAYPAALREIHDPPLALYVRGRLEERDRHAIAIVGTRHPTHYGRSVAGTLSFQLSRSGFVVVSGLAEGVDTAAHESALKAEGRTVAVIGCGMDHVYPPANRELADRIAERGAVLSEFPLGRQPDKTTFPMRNRIVSGLSMGVVVVEAGASSGALITANQALEQGRTVFAVPGRIDSPASVGTNRLIRAGARLVTGANDVLEEYEFLNLRPAAPGGSAARPMPPLTDEESRLIDALASGECDVDTVIRDTGLKAAQVSSALIGLEMKKLVRMLPGRRVERIGV